ncbi:MAG: prepilin-type N-terminal cleavage/methylation domain-containing protein [Candidatus Methylomirabilales bacterium]
MTNTRGFTAIEVLIASTIVVVALLAIAGLAHTGYRTVDWSGEDTVAMTLAKQRMEWLQNQPYSSAALAAGPPTTENLTGDYADYTRETEVQINTPVPNVKQVTVTVNTPNGRSEQLILVIVP